MLKSGSKTDTRILLDAISNDKIHLARFVLDALDGRIVDSETEGAQTPLISAVFLQDPPARCRFLNLLLQRGAKVNLPDESGRTPLSYACEMGHLDAVEILVRNGADPEAADSWGNTALMYATVTGHSAVVEFLVRAFKRLGLQIDRQNKVGNSAVEVARYLQHTECLRVLLKHSRRALDGDALAKKLSRVGDEKKALQSDRQNKVEVARYLQHTKSLEVLLNHSRRAQDGDALAEKLSRVGIGDEKKPLQMPDGTRFAPRKRSGAFRRRIQSMDSIEEYEKEGDASSPGGRIFTPKPPQKLREHPNNHLPPLLYSPRASTTPSSPAPASSPLGILLTPFSRGEAGEKAKVLDEPVRFDERYYQKRCSLPTSVLHQSQSSSRSLSTLRLLRRFTLPEFKRRSRGAPEAPEGFPGSETSLLGNEHPQVGSKPSVDSISAVKCEFDFQCKAERV